MRTRNENMKLELNARKGVFRSHVVNASELSLIGRQRPYVRSDWLTRENVKLSGLGPIIDIIITFELQ